MPSAHRHTAASNTGSAPKPDTNNIATPWSTSPRDAIPFLRQMEERDFLFTHIEGLRSLWQNGTAHRRGLSHTISLRLTHKPYTDLCGTPKWLPLQSLFSGLRGDPTPSQSPLSGSLPFVPAPYSPNGIRTRTELGVPPSSETSRFQSEPTRQR